METMQDVVAAGVQAQADLDKHLTKAIRAANWLAEITAKGVELGMMTKAIAAKSIIAEARIIPGLIATAAHAAAELHIKQTRICQENGVDTPPMTSGGGVVILGGGDR